jgi:hypothetical protein
MVEADRQMDTAAVLRTRSVAASTALGHEAVVVTALKRWGYYRFYRFFPLEEKSGRTNAGYRKRATFLFITRTISGKAVSGRSGNSVAFT